MNRSLDGILENIFECSEIPLAQDDFESMLSDRFCPTCRKSADIMREVYEHVLAQYDQELHRYENGYKELIEQHKADYAELVEKTIKCYSDAKEYHDKANEQIEKDYTEIVNHCKSELQAMENSFKNRFVSVFGISAAAILLAIPLSYALEYIRHLYGG